MTYNVRLTEEATTWLARITDRRIRLKIFERIEKLNTEPEKQGKPLVDDLAGYRSVRAIGQRYRIIYEVKPEIVTVTVIGVGIRKAGHRSDVYAKTTKLLLGSD